MDNRAFEQLVEWLADPMSWSWTRSSDNRSAANAVLAKMGELGLIEHTQHPLGGDTWTVNGNSYGRTDTIPHVEEEVRR